jgi:hypothetical protein
MQTQIAVKYTANQFGSYLMMIYHSRRRQRNAGGAKSVDARNFMRMTPKNNREWLGDAKELFEKENRTARRLGS